MARAGSDSDSGIGGMRKSGGDAVQLTIDYLKQETLGPLKGLGRFLAWGVAGSIAVTSRTPPFKSPTTSCDSRKATRPEPADPP